VGLFLAYGLYLIIQNQTADDIRVSQTVNLYSEEIRLPVTCGFAYKNTAIEYAVTSFPCVAVFYYDPLSPCSVYNGQQIIIQDQDPTPIPFCANTPTSQYGYSYKGTVIIAHLEPPPPNKASFPNYFLSLGQAYQFYVNFTDRYNSFFVFKATLSQFTGPLINNDNYLWTVAFNPTVTPLPVDPYLDYPTLNIPGGDCNTTTPDCAWAMFDFNPLVSRETIQSGKQNSLDLLAKFGGVASLVVTVMTLFAGIIRVCMGTKSNAGPTASAEMDSIR